MQIPDFQDYIVHSRKSPQYGTIVSTTRFIVEIALSSETENSREIQLTLRYKREKDDTLKHTGKILEPRGVCFLRARVQDDALHVLEYRVLSDKHVTERVFAQFNVPKFFSDLLHQSFHPKRIIITPFPEDDGEGSAHQIKYRQRYMQFERYVNPEK